MASSQSRYVAFNVSQKDIFKWCDSNTRRAKCVQTPRQPVSTFQGSHRRSGKRSTLTLHATAASDSPSASASSATGVWDTTAVDADRLPDQYDAAASEAYFSKRPLLVARRALEIGRAVSSFALALALDKQLNRVETERPTRARQLREILTALGPTFVKVGQAASIRVDLLPEAFLAELRQLQDNVPAFPTEVAKQILEEEVGAVGEVFAEFPEDPVAAASLGQVYRCRVREGGVEVAVKVQRPELLEGICLDLHLLRVAAPVLRARARLNTDLPGLVDEWGVRFVDELDYRREARNGTEFSEAMRARGLDGITAARVLEGLSTSKVLVTEWVEGRRLDESEEGDEGRLCGMALNAYLTMLLDTGVLHADPHPGNLLRTAQGQLCILDFGLVTPISTEQQYSIIQYIAHLISGNFDAVPRDLVRLGFVPPGKEEAMMDEGVVEVLVEVFSRLTKGGGVKALGKASEGYLVEAPEGAEAEQGIAGLGEARGGKVDKLLGDLRGVQAKWGNLFQIPAYFAYILRAFSVLEGIGLSSDPDYTIAQECYPYLARRLFTDNSPQGKAALREMLYGSDGRKRLNIKRLATLAEAFSSFTDSVIATRAATGPAPEPRGADDGAGAEAGGGRGAGGEAGQASGAERAAEEALSVLLAPEGSYIQELLVAEVARMTDVMVRDSILRAAETGPGRAVEALLAGQREAAQALGPARGLLLPLPLPGEVAEWLQPALRLDQEDRQVLASCQEALETIEGALQKLNTAQGSGAGAGTGGGGGGAVAEGVARAVEVAQAGAVYVPGIQAAAMRLGAEMVKMADSKLRTVSAIRQQQRLRSGFNGWTAEEGTEARDDAMRLPPPE